MKDIQLFRHYNQVLNEVVQNYRGHKFFYSPPVSTIDPDLTLVGISGLKLKFIDNKDNLAYVSLEEFLTSMEHSEYVLSKKQNSRIPTTYPTRKIPYVPNAVRNMAFIPPRKVKNSIKYTRALVLLREA